jgi:two-component system response regulator FixJ
MPRDPEEGASPDKALPNETSPIEEVAPVESAPALPVVHIVDDDEAVRRSLALLLNSFGHPSQTYESAEEFIAALDMLAPGCVIIDIRMPGMSGLTLQQELRRRGCAMPVVIVTGHGDVSLAVHAMKAGAIDFIEKPYSERDLSRAVNAALVRLQDARQTDAAAHSAASKVAQLTPRELDVLRGLVDGRPNKVIAHDLGISPRTVEIHRANLMDKLDCKSLAEVVRVALLNGPMRA